MESTKRKINDNYGKNPMTILSKNDQKLREISELNKDKTNRVTKIFQSNQVKNTIQPNENWKCVIQPKIYNEDSRILKLAAKEYKNSAGKKNFNHVVENNRVFYY
jgi:hypothetical protein